MDFGHSHSQKASDEAIEEQLKGDLLQEVTKIMVNKHGKDIIPQLEKMDINTLLGTSRTKRCAEPAPGTKCSKEADDCSNKKNIRSFSGVCNNLGSPWAGTSMSEVRRLLGSANYVDGIGAIRDKSVTGSPLPSTREISNKLHSDNNNPLLDPATNHLHMQFGQFIAHDIIFMPSSVGPNGETLDCSSCNSSKATDYCAPISVTDGDPYFPNGTCLRLTRALNAQKGLGQRRQINQNTHFLDLSAVYGSEECVTKSLRSFSGGELKEFNNGYVLPPQAPNDTNCQSKNPYYCFLAGDFRNSLHPGLIPHHVVYIKEHNRIARSMKAIQPGWSDEKLFQEARRLLIARHQHHVYTEYLPKLLGQKTMNEFGLTSKTSGYFTGYSESFTGSLSAEFSAAAFRFGHSQARADHPRLTNDNRELAQPVGLGSNIFYTDSLYENNTGGTESMLEGMLQRPSMAVDRTFTFPIRNQLFEVRGKKASGVDLVAVNIMRGRDVGLYPYNDYRTFVGLRKATTFDDLLGEMDEARVSDLKTVYADVNDIDLYTGLLMERPANGSLLGRTGTYIIAETFAALKKGDRFFYESKVDNTRGLTPEELASIRATSLSKLICGVSPSMTLVAKDVFDPLASTDLEQQVRSSIAAAKKNIEVRNRLVKTVKDGSGHSHSQKASPEAEEEQIKGDLLQEVTKILVDKNGNDIIPQLEKIDVKILLGPTRSKRNSESAAGATCVKETEDCSNKKNIRSFSGVCNNLRYPLAGAAMTTVRRLLGNARYEDVIGAIRNRSYTGTPLPSTREVSNKLHSDGNNGLIDPITNHLHMQFGQSIAHDIIFMPVSTGPNGGNLDCSTCASAKMSENCAPITVPDDDPYFPKGSCIRMTRALNAQKGLGQREQTNQNSHLLDLSNIYGSQPCVAATLRTFSDGELKFFNYAYNYALPPQAPNDTNCQSKKPYYCFKDGDNRNSVQPGLAPVNVVYIKEHNQVARNMKKLRPHWDDEMLYQEARRLMIANYQHHVYNEYLPKLLGVQTMNEFGLTSQKSGFFTGYNDGILPTVSVEFSAAAFRFGHSQVRSDFPRVSNQKTDISSPIPLGNNTFYADALYDKAAGGVEAILEGMIQSNGMGVDKQFTFPIRNQVLETRGKQGSGIDLVAVNLMRGRDVGLHPYNSYRTLVGLPRAETFDDLLSQMDRASVEALKSVYPHVNDIDLYTGILLERPANGALLGRTGAYIIAETFAALKKGDRFFYVATVPGTRGLSPKELASIRASSMSRLFCAATPGMALVAKDLFDPTSPRVRCDSLKHVDVAAFVDTAD